MPIPFILGAAAVVAGISGVGSGISGASKMKDASDTMKRAKRKFDDSVSRYESANKRANKTMDSLGKLELRILDDHKNATAVISKIKNAKFEEMDLEDVDLPKYNPEEIENVSIAANAVLSAFEGTASAGIAGGLAAMGTTQAVMAFGAASTGTAISSLGGAAATNATLAFLGGGSLAAGGGGVALGTTILGASTLGVGLLAGGFLINMKGRKLSEKADEAMYQANRQEEISEEICSYLYELDETAENYKRSIQDAKEIYVENFYFVENMVENQNKTDFRYYNNKEKIKLQNLVLMIKLLKEMCSVKLLNIDEDSSDEENIHEINYSGIEEAIEKSEKVLEKVA